MAARNMRAFRAFLVLLACSLAVACSHPDKTTEKANVDLTHPVKGDWAVVRLEAEPDNLNPLISTTGVGHYVMWGVNNSQVYELLMGYNNKGWGVTEPILIDAPPTISDDHLTYTITIRDGVKWHDGQPFTADDVLFTFKAAACPLADTGALRSYLTDIADIQVDGRSLRFSMSKPNVNNVGNIVNVLPIVAKHVFDPDGLLSGFSYKDIIGPKGKTDPRIKKFAEQFNTHPANRAPVGTGPWKFEKWDSGREITLARNDDYYGKKPFLDKIVYRIIVDYTAALAALKAGEVDLQPRLLPIQYKEQTSGPAFDQQFTKTQYSIPSESVIVWNNDRPFFKDKRVRQALTMLIDRQKIIDSIRLGLGTIGISPVNPQSPNFDPNIKAWPYDTKRAGELLDEAGWIDHDGDGIRDKDGVKFKFEFLGSMGSTTFKQLSPVMAEEFRKAGIEMTDRVIEFALMTKALKEHRFDASTLTFSSDLDQDEYQNYHSSSAAGGTNFANFKNAESDRMLEQMRLEFNAENRKQISWKWQELIHDQQPMTFVYYSQEPAAYSTRFQNVQWLPLRPGYDLNRWWVPLPLQKHSNATAP
jgi:peptide/nickel transport system substrate-binding protein